MSNTKGKTDKQLAKSIETKLENLCKLLGTLEYRVVKHPIRNDFDDLLTRKQLINELKNVVTYGVDGSKLWLYESFKPNFMQSVRSAVEGEIYEEYEEEFINDFGMDAKEFENSDLFKAEFGKIFKQYEEAEFSQLIEWLIDEIVEEGIYNVEDNFFEILDKGKVLEINSNNVANFEYYFGDIVIHYALVNGLKIPYVDLNESTNGSKRALQSIHKTGGIWAKNTTRINMLVDSKNGIFRNIFTTDERYYMSQINTKIAYGQMGLIIED